jgi:hypothetical protein
LTVPPAAKAETDEAAESCRWLVLLELETPTVRDERVGNGGNGVAGELREIITDGNGSMKIC